MKNIHGRRLTATADLSDPIDTNFGQRQNRNPVHLYCRGQPVIVGNHSIKVATKLSATSRWIVSKVRSPAGFEVPLGECS
jgi:hypothetical protein